MGQVYGRFQVQVSLRIEYYIDTIKVMNSSKKKGGGNNHKMFEDDKFPFKPTLRVSKENTKGLDINFIPHLPNGNCGMFK